MRVRQIVICGLFGATRFFHIINGMILEKILLNMKLVFRFFLQLLLEKCHILGRNERDAEINIRKCSCKVPAFLVRF
jgi:hypothetical protein